MDDDGDDRRWMTAAGSRVCQARRKHAMRKSIVLLVIALATGTAAAQDAKPTPAPAADAKPKEAPADPGGATAEIKAGTGVENREVVGEATSFPAGSTVFVWSRVTNGEGNIKHVW